MFKSCIIVEYISYMASCISMKYKMINYLLDIGTPTNSGMAIEHWANPQALAKFLALTFS